MSLFSILKKLSIPNMLNLDTSYNQKIFLLQKIMCNFL